MRFSLLLALLTVAGFAASTTAATSARTPAVNYWFKAEFGIGIDLRWSTDTGSRNEPCASWAREEGEYEVNAASVGVIPPGKKAGSFIHPLPGLQSLDKDLAWAILYAGGGQARVHMKRTLRQQGQTNACGSTPAVPTKFPPNDCGARSYISRSPFIRQDFRDRYLTLEDVLTPPRKGLRRAISIDAPAQQLLYQRCDVPAASFNTGVGNVALLVSPQDLSKLRALKLGHTLRLEFRPDNGNIGGLGGCMSRKLVDGEYCAAGIDIHLDIKRVKPPSGR